MVSNAVSLNASSYRTLFEGGSGALYIPVSPSSVVYAQFDHVHGIAAKAGENGVPVSKVKMLDTLINQLVSMKTRTALPSKEELSSISEELQDILIENYQKQIKDAVEKASTPDTYGLAGLMPESGSIVSIRA